MGIRARLFIQGMEAFEGVAGDAAKTNYISAYLGEKNYEKVRSNVFKKGDAELIEVFKENSTWQYRNLRPPYDKGTFVSFIANRMGRPDTPVHCSDPITVSAAVLIAKLFIKEKEEKLQLLKKKSLKSERTIDKDKELQRKPKR